MKSIFYSLIFWSAISNLSAQVIQIGMVREQNSGGKPISGVQVNFQDAVPTNSDDRGWFRLAFRGKKAGDVIFFQEVRKQGYEVVNEKELQIMQISSNDSLGNDIILAKAGKLDAARKEYYDISNKALTAGFKKEEKALQEKLEKSLISATEYDKQYAALFDQYREQQKKLDDLSDLFARINFDDVSSEYQRSMELFKSGNIDDAIEILEKIDLPNRIKKRLKEKKRIEKAGQEIAGQKEKNEREIKDDLQGMQLQAQLYVLNFQIQNAETMYDQILRLDSTDLTMLTEAAGFYRDYHRYDKAKKWYSAIIGHPDAEQWEVGDALVNFGDMHTRTGSLPDALAAFEESEKIYMALWQGDTTSSQFKNGLAISHQQLGNAHINLGNLDKALGFYEEFNRKEKELYTAYPNKVDFKNGLAISYQYIGSAYSSLGNLDKALEFFEEMNKHFKELYTAYLNNMDFKNGLAASYQHLGKTHINLGNLEKALGFFQECNRLVKELYTAYPLNVDFKNYLAISYSDLGLTHGSLGNLDKALVFIQEYNRLIKELYAAYPLNVDFKYFMASSYQHLGYMHSKLGNLDEALGFFEERKKLMKELYTAYPNKVDFKNGLADSYQRLGYLHHNLGNLDKALVFFEEYNRLEKELYGTYPQNVAFKNGLAISYQFLGYTHSSLGNLDKALEFFEDFTKLMKELYAAYPLNVNFKYGLAASYQHLGYTQSSLGNLDKALGCFEEMYKHFKELHAVHPNNVDFKSSLADIYQTLGNFSFEKQNSPSQALLHYQKADTLWTELVRDAPDNAEYQKQLAEVRGKLAELGQNMPETMPQSQQREKAEAAVTSFTLTQETSLRAAPASDARIFRRFKPGDQVRLLEKTDEWWWKVAFGGVKGYVKAALLKEMENR